MVKAIVISNTSPLINLGMVDALDLIPALFTSEEFDIVVPAEVMKEIKPPLNRRITDMQEKGQIIISPPFMESVMNKVIPIAVEIVINAKTPSACNPKQHYTEAYVIVRGEMAKLSLGSAFVLIDEKVPKTIATKEKALRAMSHINIIEECVNEGMLTPKNGLGMFEKLASKGVKYRQEMLNHYRMIWS